MHKITLADMVANVIRRADIKRYIKRKKNRNVESRTLIPMKNRGSRKALRERDHLWSSEISNFPGRAASNAESKQPRSVSRVENCAAERRFRIPGAGILSASRARLVHPSHFARLQQRVRVGHLKRVTYRLTLRARRAKTRLITAALLASLSIQGGLAEPLPSPDVGIHASRHFFSATRDFPRFIRDA